MKNQLWILLFCLVPLHALGAADGVHITYQINTTAQSQSINGQVEYYFQDGDMLAEMNFAQNPLGKIHMLDKAGKSYILYPDEKSYMEVSDFSSLAHPQNKKQKAQGDFKSTGEKKKIAGYECEVFTRTDKKTVQNVCVNQSLQNQFKSILQSMDKMNQDQMEGVKGFPLEIDIKSTDSKNPYHSVTIVERIEKKNVKNKTMLPKNYTKTETPAIPKNAQEMIKKMQESANDSDDSKDPMEAMKKMAEEMKKKYGK